MELKKHIPNAITCCNLACGCAGIISVFNYNLELAAYFIWLANVFDFFDGFVARLLKVSSPIGKELDSLADVVSFGVLPSFIIYQIILMNTQITELSYAAFIIAIFGALRLAKFNVDTRQTDSFRGLPIPANALFISSFPFIINNPDYSYIAGLFVNPIFLIACAVVLAILMVSDLPLFALKFKNSSWVDNKLKYIFLISSIILLVVLKYLALPAIIILYILLSLFENMTKKKKGTYNV